ncbi:MAG: hypothetical protein GDA55_05830 [Cellvibrionales bacterium]|nr:hypothetical protein [Cellvibrionales bacterium]
MNNGIGFVIGPILFGLLIVLWMVLLLQATIQKREADREEWLANANACNALVTEHGGYCLTRRRTFIHCNGDGCQWVPLDDAD